MSLLFIYPGNEDLGFKLLQATGFEKGECLWHSFPDGESLVTLMSTVKDRHVHLLCSLSDPDEKSIPLMFFAEALRELGARSITLIAPYLAYMRQDKRFHEGEAITSKIYGSFLSKHFDALITVDPHLHRYESMSDIYTIPVNVVHAASAIGSWIVQNIKKPLLIGPDAESKQWIQAVAQDIRAPYEILSKTRRGDQNVSISIPDTTDLAGYTPVLLDDIIASGGTMIQAVSQLRVHAQTPPVCIGIHAIFAQDCYERLLDSGAGLVVTCNSIMHASNRIDISSTIASALISGRNLPG